MKEDVKAAAVKSTDELALEEIIRQALQAAEGKGFEQGWNTALTRFMIACSYEEPETQSSRSHPSVQEGLVAAKVLAFIMRHPGSMCDQIVEGLRRYGCDVNEQEVENALCQFPRAEHKNGKWFLGE